MLLVVLGLPVSAGAMGGGVSGTTRHVATTGTDAGDCSVAASPCRTVSFAVSQAAAGDTVAVAAGAYPEMVTVDRSLVFRGANAGRSAGVFPQGRGAESVVKGFRSPGTPYPSPTYSFNVTIDGFRIDPQGDADLIAGTVPGYTNIPYHLVSLFGGPQVSVRNNVFDGGPFVADCSYTCTTMTDFALLVQSGSFEIKDNAFSDFRRPVDISQNKAAYPIVAGFFWGNSFRHITSRAIWLREGDCFGPSACGGNAVDTIAGITLKANSFDGTGSFSPVTGGPAGLVMTTAGNLVVGNVFRGNDPGVFDQVCDPYNHPTSSPNTFVANTFTANTDGILYYAAAPGSCPPAVNARIFGNSFSGDSGYGVRWYPESTAPNDLDARCNWWGAPTGPGTPGADKISAGVLATPWNLSPFGPCVGH